MTKFFINILIIISGVPFIFSCAAKNVNGTPGREIISINEGWNFYKYDKDQQPDNLIYDVRPEISQNNEYLVADAKPTEALKLEAQTGVLKPWILPAANNFLSKIKRNTTSVRKEIRVWIFHLCKMTMTTLDGLK